MSDPREPGDLPPDLPPEYAEAYRRGYQRAFLEATRADDESRVVEPVETTPEPRVVEPVETTPEPRVVEPVETTPEPEPEPGPEPEPVGTTIRGPLFADEAWDADEDVEPTRVVPLGDLTAAADPAGPADPGPAPAPEPGFDSGPIWVGSAAQVEDDAPAPEDHLREPRPGWFVPAVLGGLVLALVLGAYVIGRVFSSSVDDADVQAEGPERVVMGDDAGGPGGQKDGKGDGSAQREAKDAYQGTVEITAIGGATASCQAPSSVDAAGNEIAYPPTSAYDGDLTTAWRCNGAGVGQTLSLTFAEPVEVGELGLVPGYAKTDPRSGVDRYAENNRITRVRWTFPDGSSVVQRLDGSPTNRSLQSLRVRPVQADSVTLEVLRTVRGDRNTVAVSEVQVGRTVG